MDMRTRIISGLGAAALALATAAPTAAASPEPIAWTDAFDTQHACGIVEHQRVDARGAALFAADGTWLRDRVRFHFDSVFESTITGRTLTASGRQVAEFTPEGLTLTGQGAFLRGRGGVLVMDVGRLVVDWDGGTIFATPKVLPFSDEAQAEIDAALCAALG
jgi:hypothetical protein